MVNSDKTIKSLKDQLKIVKLELSAFKRLQQKKDRVDQEYKNSHNKFKTVFEQSSLGHKFIDSNLRIIKVNKALVKLLGYSKKELLGSRITDIVVPEFAQSWKELQYQLWTNNSRSFSIDTCIFKKDKSVIWCHVTSILLEDNGETLGYTILENVTVRKNIEIDLKEANNREQLFNEQLLEMTITTQEKERTRIAEDLHNSLGQLLYGVRLNLDHLNMKALMLHEQNTLTIENTKGLLTECITETRRISHDLMPSVLRDFGLKEAIQDICKQLNRTIQFNCEFTGLDSRLPKYLEKAIYRMVQELAMNLITHANATKASLKLGVSKTDVLVRVEDNGKGFNTSNLIADEGIGLQSIKTKLHLLKGELDISSSIGKGTIISIRLPSKHSANS